MFSLLSHLEKKKKTEVCISTEKTSLKEYKKIHVPFRKWKIWRSSRYIIF